MFTRRKRQIFKFESKWIKDNEGAHIIDHCWNRERRDLNRWSKIRWKLQEYSKALTRWQSTNKWSTIKELDEKVKLLEEKQKQEVAGTMEEIKRLEKEIAYLMELEEMALKG